MRKGLVIGICLFTFILSCKKKDTGIVEAFNGDIELVKLGGNCSVNDQTSYAFSYEINGLDANQALQFYVGNSFFNQNWVEAPSSTTARDGLGPLYNAKSCATCHFRDGRGAPMSNTGLLFRLGDGSANLPDGIYGGQLQDYGVSTVTNEGLMGIQYVEIPGIYPDGTPYSLRKPNYTVMNPNFGAVNGNTGISPRVGGQMIGLGLLELIPENQLLANVDENDVDGDGISGRANYAYDIVDGLLKIGRFGWKANVASIPHQVAGAFNGDIGITSTYFPNENHTSNQPSCNGLPNGGTPEIEDNDLAAVVLYSRTLAVPYRRNTTNSDVKAGAQLFRDLKCIACHKMNFTTGSGGTITALKNQKIAPYTDLLLHDMGADLADQVPDHLATGFEWRTPPLWGLGLIWTVNGHTNLLHDGRARSIEEAILWHGGEGLTSKQAFMSLSAANRIKLIRYLESL